MPLTANGATPKITASATFSEPPGINATATTPSITASYTLTFQPQELVANVTTPALTGSLTLSEGPKLVVAAKTPAITAMIGVATPIPITPIVWNTRVAHEMFAFGKSAIALVSGRVNPYLTSTLEIRQVGKLQFTMSASSAVTSATLRVQNRMLAVGVAVVPEDKLRFTSASVLTSVPTGSIRGTVTPQLFAVSTRVVQSTAALRLGHSLLITGPQISTGISVIARVTPSLSATGIGTYYHSASMRLHSTLLVTGPAAPAQGMSLQGSIKNTLVARGSRAATATMRLVNRVRIAHGHVGLIQLRGRLEFRSDSMMTLLPSLGGGVVRLRIIHRVMGYMAPLTQGLDRCLVINTVTGEATQWLIPGLPVGQYIVGGAVSVNSYVKTTVNVTTDRIPSSTSKSRMEYVYTMLDGKPRSILNRAITDSVNREYNVRTTQTGGYSQNRSTFGMGVDGYELQAGFKVQTDSQIEIRALTVGVSTLKRRL